MKKMYVVGGIGAGVILVLLTIFFIAKRVGVDSADSFPIAKHIRMRYKLVNTSDQLLDNVSVKLFTPVPLMPNQRIVSLTSNKTFTESLDVLGNKILVFELDTVNPYQTRFLDLRVNLEMAIKPQGKKDSGDKNFLADSAGIEASDPKIQNLAAKLRKGNPVESLRAHYRWIIDNIDYAGYIKDDLGALYALEHKKGDCTEYAYLVAALARAEGVPARVIGGYVYPEDAMVRAEDYHNWTEVLLNGQWHIIDAQKQRFMEKYDEYIAFRIIQDDSSELKTSHQIVISSENIEVSL